MDKWKTVAVYSCFQQRQGLVSYWILFTAHNSSCFISPLFWQSSCKWIKSFAREHILFAPYVSCLVDRLHCSNLSGSLSILCSSIGLTPSFVNKCLANVGQFSRAKGEWFRASSLSHSLFTLPRRDLLTGAEFRKSDHSKTVPSRPLPTFQLITLGGRCGESTYKSRDPLRYNVAVACVHNQLNTTVSIQETGKSNTLSMWLIQRLLTTEDSSLFVHKRECLLIVRGCVV